LFATHFSKTNDRAEIKALRQPLAKLMVEQTLPLFRARMKRGDLRSTLPMEELEARMGEDAELLFDSMVRSMPSAPYLTCFSSHAEPHHAANGLLTMWRLYGGAGQGIALGFDTANLVAAYDRASAKYAMGMVFLDRVGYGAEDPQVKARLKESASLIQLHARNLLAMLDGKEPDDAGDDLMKFLVLTTSTKHPDFQDEREVRVVVTRSLNPKQPGKKPLDGPKHRLLVPCLEALDEVLIGPSNRQASLAKSVKAKLKAAGYERVAVRKSATPFRHL